MTRGFLEGFFFQSWGTVSILRLSMLHFFKRLFAAKLHFSKRLSKRIQHFSAYFIIYVAKCSLPTGLIPLTGSRRTSPLSPESPDCSRPPRYDVRDFDDCRRWPIGRRKSKVNMKVTSKRRMETRSEATEGGRGVLSSCPSGAVTK